MIYKKDSIARANEYDREQQEISVPRIIEYQVYNLDNLE